MGRIVLENVTKSYDNVKVVEETNLEIRDKEFLVLVGPSGCGKTTTLRMIAGLEEISGGKIYIDDKAVNDMPPKDRDIAMVFQNYALYPNKNVYDNMAFGLKMRRIPKKEIDERVKSVAKMLDLEELLKRKPSQLSGGQRQRVAVGRAVVRRPKVFLMDEPLSNLDAKLRVHMRAELIMLHQKLQTTIVYVTHDQVEAMTMGDRLVVLNKGKIQQVNTPLHLYNKPDNLFVAGFIGSPAMNFINCEFVKRDNEYILTNNDFRIILPAEKITEKVKKYLNKKIIMGIRPEQIYDVQFSEKYIGNPKNVVVAKVGVVEPLGSETLVSIILSEKMITAKVDSRTKAEAGNSINFYLNADEVHIFDPETEENISLA